jgi:GT2 family glycosyltransferase
MSEKVKVVALKSFKTKVGGQVRKREVYEEDYDMAVHFRDLNLVRFAEVDDIHCEKVSIVILVKDALHYVQGCIKSLVDYTNNFELIIVDNDSKKPTRDWLRNIDFVDYKLITNRSNKGVSYGWNQGIKEASCDYVCLLNSDTRLTPNWLGSMVKGFEVLPNVGIVGPSTCHAHTIQSLQTLKGKSNIRDQKVINDMAFGLKEGYKETPVVGFCWTIKKEVFDDIGAFDYKRYGIATHEDLDFAWRALRRGWKSVWCKGSYVHHFGNKTTREMGVNPGAIRKKIKPIFDERKKNKNLYVENDSEVKNVKEIKCKIPILMITWDRLDYTKKAIEAIKKNTEHPYELFIYDNGSKADTVKYLKGLQDKNIKIYFSPVNTGLIPPMNEFLQRYKDSYYIAKVDNDTIVSQGWLGKLKKVMDDIPFRAVEANHYLMLNYDIKDNWEYFNELYQVDYGDEKLVLSNIVGGTGVLIRRNMVSQLPDMKGTLAGWIQWQAKNFGVSAFYTGVWVDRLDQTDTNKYKEPSDFPKYDLKIDRLRKRNKKKKPIKKGMFKLTNKKTKGWYVRI